MKTVLIFANGDANDGEMVQRALHESPDAWVIAADGGARQAAYFGLSVHTVIGDLDSLSEAEVSALTASGAEIHRYPPEKDETDLELALLLAASSGAQHIRIIAGIGDRIDQTMGNMYLLALPQLRGLDVRLVAGKQSAWLLPSGDHHISGAAGDTLSLLPVGGETFGIRTEGLYYPLHDEALLFGPARGMSNVMVTGAADIHIGTGWLLVVHTLGRA